MAREDSRLRARRMGKEGPGVRVGRLQPREQNEGLRSGQGPQKLSCLAQRGWRRDGTEALVLDKGAWRGRLGVLGSGPQESGDRQHPPSLPVSCRIPARSSRNPGGPSGHTEPLRNPQACPDPRRPQGECRPPPNPEGPGLGRAGEAGAAPGTAPWACGWNGSRRSSPGPSRLPRVPWVASPPLGSPRSPGV